MVGNQASFHLGGRGYGRVAAVTYQFPLQESDRKELFDQWRELNPLAWGEIREHALLLWRRGHKRISTKYLVEAQRYESSTSATPVPFTDQNGKTRAYNINNSDTAIMARVLLAEFPDMPIETRGK